MGNKNKQLKQWRPSIERSLSCQRDSTRSWKVIPEKSCVISLLISWNSPICTLRHLKRELSISLTTPKRAKTSLPASMMLHPRKSQRSKKTKAKNTTTKMATVLSQRKANMAKSNNRIMARKASNKTTVKKANSRNMAMNSNNKSKMAKTTARSRHMVKRVRSTVKKVKSTERATKD